MMNTNLIADIRAHALKHWNESWAWSTIYECYTDEELAELATEYQATTLEQFIQAHDPMASVIDEVWEDRAADAINSRF